MVLLTPMLPPFLASSPPVVPPGPPRCLYCAAIVPAGARACPRCGLDFEATHEKRVGAPCPRCPGEKLLPAAVDEASVYACRRCHGCFLHALDWDALLARADDGSPLSLATFVPPPPGQGPTPRQLFSGGACPVCGGPTRRFEFAGHAGLWVDACPAHGLWLDAGELVAAIQVHKAHPDELEQPVHPTGGAPPESGAPPPVDTDQPQSRSFAAAVASDAVRTLVAFAKSVVDEICAAAVR